MGKSISNYLGSCMALSDPHASADWLYGQFNHKPDWNHPDPQHRFAATKRSAKMSKKGRKK